MSRFKTAPSNLESVMHTRAFNDGVKDARKNAPFNYEYSRSNKEQWNYERGRQFVIAGFTDNVKNGKKLSRHAVWEFEDMVMDKYVI